MFSNLWINMIEENFLKTLIKGIRDTARSVVCNIIRRLRFRIGDTKARFQAAS